MSSDQADGLRRWSRREATVPFEPPVGRSGPGVVIALSGAKGGAGTSTLALGLALALRQRGRRVTLVDADPGAASLELLCGIKAPADLGDALVDGRSPASLLVDGPGGIRLLPGAHSLRTPADELPALPALVAAALPSLAAGSDFVVVDSGPAMGPTPAAIADLVDASLLVATPDPAAIDAALAVLSRLRGTPGPAPKLVVNQASSRAEGRNTLRRIGVTSREVLGYATPTLGLVRTDRWAAACARRRRPLLIEAPGSRASRDLAALAVRLDPVSLEHEISGGLPTTLRSASHRLAEMTRRPREAIARRMAG